MTLAWEQGPVGSSALDSIVRMFGTGETDKMLRRISDTTFIVLGRTTDPGDISRHGYRYVIGTVTDSGVTFGSLIDTAYTAGQHKGFAALASGQFIVITENDTRTMKARLHAGDGSFLSEATIVPDTNSMTLAGNEVHWGGDYFDAVEITAGKVLVMMGTERGSGSAREVACWQLDVTGTTVTLDAGGPVRVAGPYALADFDGGPDPKGAFIWTTGVAVGALWGNRNSQTAVYAVGPGPTAIADLSLGNDVRMIEPVIGRASGNVLGVYGENDLYGSGHAGSGAEGDALVNIPFDGTAFGSVSLTQFIQRDSDNFPPYFIFDAEGSPKKQQAVNRHTRAVIPVGGTGSDLRLEEFAYSTPGGPGHWQDADTPVVTTPGASRDPNWVYYEGLTERRGIVFAVCYDYDIGLQVGLVWVTSRGTTIPNGAQVGGTRVRWS